MQIKTEQLITIFIKLEALYLYTKDKKYRNVIFSIDQAKEFDGVAHSWLLKLLEKYYLGAKLINCIKLLYKNQTSNIIVNNTLSGY